MISHLTPEEQAVAGALVVAGFVAGVLVTLWRVRW